jgi:hypothetical protein
MFNKQEIIISKFNYVKLNKKISLGSAFICNRWNVNWLTSIVVPCMISGQLPSGGRGIIMQENVIRKYKKHYNMESGLYTYSKNMGAGW